MQPRRAVVFIDPFFSEIVSERAVLDQVNRTLQNDFFVIQIKFYRKSLIELLVDLLFFAREGNFDVIFIYSSDEDLNRAVDFITSVLEKRVFWIRSEKVLDLGKKNEIR